jgi:SPP1 gp7 family putative phage head morphogenesis protein
MPRKSPAQPPADPASLDEAVRWFRERLLMSDAEFAALEEVTHDEAFTVAGVSQLDMVAEVWTALDRAVARGETLENFRKRVSARLTAAWGRDQPYRIETVYRNQVQRAFSAGRWVQMNDPAVKVARPFRRFSAIVDLRTTATCRTLDGVVRPADDPWWEGRVPPLHFSCRSLIVTVSKSEAGTDPLPPGPDVAADEGFGGSPDIPWEPDLTKYPPELATGFQKTGTGP